MDKNAAFGALYANDEMNRLLPGEEQTGPIRKDRAVGVFYFLTHGAGKTPVPPAVNVTRLMRETPEALADWDHPAWGNGPLYWDEPLFG